MFAKKSMSIARALPVIAVPLREPDPDVALDLGHVFRRAYETGPYRKVIRYGLPPDPELPPGDAAWAAAAWAAGGCCWAAAMA